MISLSRDDAPKHAEVMDVHVRLSSVCHFCMVNFIILHDHCLFHNYVI